MRARRLALLAALGPLLAPRPAAAEAPLAERRILVEVGGRATSFDYAEYGVNGAFLDGESGILPGVHGAVEARAGPVALRASTSVAGAELGYAGHVQSSSVQLNGLAVGSTSGAHLVAAGVEVAVDVPYGRGVALLAGAERRRWDRSIHATTVVSRTGATVPVGGLAETYRWDALAVGVRVPLLSRGALGWDAEGRIVRTWAPSMTLERPAGDVKLRLGERTGWALGTALRIDVGPVAALRLGFSLERHAFGESDVDRTAGVWEPESTTRTATLEVGLGARF